MGHPSDVSRDTPGGQWIWKFLSDFTLGMKNRSRISRHRRRWNFPDRVPFFVKSKSREYINFRTQKTAAGQFRSFRWKIEAEILMSASIFQSNEVSLQWLICWLQNFNKEMIKAQNEEKVSQADYEVWEENQLKSVLLTQNQSLSRQYLKLSIFL